MKKKTEKSTTIANTRKLTEQSLVDIEKYASEGYWEKDIATLLGYEETYFSKEIKHLPQVSQAIKKGRIKFKQKAIKRIQAAGDKQWQALAWLLERMFKDEFALNTKLELPNASKGQITVSWVK